MHHQTTHFWIAISDSQPPWIGWMIHRQLTLKHKTVGRRLLGHGVIPTYFGMQEQRSRCLVGSLLPNVPWFGTVY